MQRYNWKAVERENLTMPVSAFLKLCRCKHLIPHLLNLEDLKVYITEVYTPMTVAEYTWTEENKMLVEIYNKDVNPHDSRIEEHDDEPRLFFHEFIFLLAIIASKKNTSDSLPAAKIENFFVQNLEFMRVDDDLKYIPTFDEIIEDDDEASDYEIMDQQTELKRFLEERQRSEASFAINFEDVLQSLDEMLPMIPGKPEVVQMQPRPDPTKEPIRIKFGKFKPKVKGEDDAKKKKVAKAKPPARKKDEKPPPVMRWADAPKDDPPTTFELMC